MTGRQYFKIIKYPMKVVIFLLRLMPNIFLEFLYDFSSIIPTRLGVLIRYIIISSISNNIGENVYIGRFVVLKNIRNLEIGNNVSIHDLCYVDALGGISIGNDVSIAHNSSLISFEHSWGNKELPIKYNVIISRKIVIEDDVWIGCGTRVLSGAYISKRTVIAAGTVFNTTGVENSIYAGVPSRKVKEI